MSTLLILGATGNVGSNTINALRERDFNGVVRAASRQATDTFDGYAQPVRFDFADADTFAPATEGADVVFFNVPPVHPDLISLVGPYIDYLREHGPKRIVHLSAFGAEHLPVYGPVIEAVQAAGFDLTVLEPTFFASNFGTYEREGIEHRNVIFQASGEGRTGYVNPADIGHAAAVVLTQEGHVGQTYRLTGPEALSLHTVAQQLSDVRGVPTQYVPATEQQYRSALAEAQVPSFVADYMVPLYDLLREGKVEALSPDLKRLTGRDPLPLRTQLERDFGAAA